MLGNRITFLRLERICIKHETEAEIQMKKYLCGVDVGGTKLSTGLFEEDGFFIPETTIQRACYRALA